MRTHTKTFHIRFTEKEYVRLCKRSKQTGLPKSTYIRHMINGYAPKEHPPIPFFDFIRAAYKCGTLLNQLCIMGYKFHRLHEQTLNAAMNELYTLMAKVQKEILYGGDLDVPAALERGLQVAENDQQEGMDDAQ